MKDDEATGTSRWSLGAKWEPFDGDNIGAGSWFHADGNAFASVIPSDINPGKFFGLCICLDVADYFDTQDEAKTWCEEQLRGNK